MKTQNLELKEEAKNYILAQIKEMQEAILKNDFFEVYQICDYIGRECEEILEY